MADDEIEATRVDAEPLVVAAEAPTMMAAPTIVRQQSPDGTWWRQQVNNAGSTEWVPE